MPSVKSFKLHSLVDELGKRVPSPLIPGKNPTIVQARGEWRVLLIDGEGKDIRPGRGNLLKRHVSKNPEVWKNKLGKVRKCSPNA